MESYKTVTLLAAIVVFVLVFNTNMEICSAATATTTTKFIRTSCSSTTYPNICIKSLSFYSNKIKTSYRMLAYTSLYVSLKSTQKSSTIITKLMRRRDLKRSEAAAVKDCVENMSDSMDELQQSLKEMMNLNQTEIDFKMSNIKTWVSAALSDDDTCMEELDEESVKGNVRMTIRKNVESTAQLTSNALAIVNSFNNKLRYQIVELEELDRYQIVEVDSMKVRGLDFQSPQRPPARRILVARHVWNCKCPQTNGDKDPGKNESE